MNTLLRYGLLLIPLWFAAQVAAAPLPPFPQVDVSGTVAAADWFPVRHVQGVAGMSGSAGHDRTFPAHYIVKLTAYSGVSAATAREMTRLIDWHALDESSGTTRPPFILLRIDHPDRTFLRSGMQIRVTGYSISGDEGGTWTAVNKVVIIDP